MSNYEEYLAQQEVSDAKERVITDSEQRMWELIDRGGLLPGGNSTGVREPRNPNIPPHAGALAVSLEASLAE